MMLINPAGYEQSMTMFRKSIVMLLTCFTNDEVLSELKHIDGMVIQGKAFESLKAIRALYPVEDEILNTPQMPAATIDEIRRELAPWA
jgi:flagellar protein FlbT